MKNAQIILIVLSGVLMLSSCSRQTAEEKGKAMADEKLGIAKGMGESLKEKGRNTAESLAQGVGDTMRGVGDGFENSFGIKYRLNPSLSQAGIKITRIQREHAGTENDGIVLSAYVTSSTPVKGTIRLIAFDRHNQEMGRSKKELTLTDNAAHYEDFTFDKRLQMEVVENFVADFITAKSN